MKCHIFLWFSMYNCFVGEVIAGFGNFASILWWIQWFLPNVRYGNRKFVGYTKTDVSVSGDDGGGGYPRHRHVKLLGDYRSGKPAEVEEL